MIVAEAVLKFFGRGLQSSRNIHTPKFPYGCAHWVSDNQE